MAKVLGICNLHNEPSLGEITEDRPLGTVSFLGRYGLMDFTLSNFSNSGINIMPILVEKYNDLVRSHIRDGSIWINNTKIGFLRLFMNEKTLNNPAFNTDVNNIIANKFVLKSIECDYVLIASPHFLYSFDFNEMVEAIEQSEADIVCLYSHRRDADKDFINCDSFTLEGNAIIGSRKNSGRAKEADIGLSAYIFKPSSLEKLIDGSRDISELYTLRDLVNHAIHNKSMKIYGCEFQGYVLPILSLQDYVDKSFELLNYENRQKLFLEDWPIYTTSHNTPPAMYMEGASVKNSFIANGSIINGKVENSILSRDVIVEEGAEVKNCIIFTHSKVGEKVKLKYVLADKHSVIKQVKRLSGEKEEILVVTQGAKI